MKGIGKAEKTEKPAFRCACARDGGPAERQGRSVLATSRSPAREEGLAAAVRPRGGYPKGEHHGGYPQRYVWTPELDAILVGRYDGHRNRITELMAEFPGFPRWTVTKRVRQLGLARIREPAWSPEDEAWLAAHLPTTSWRACAAHLHRSICATRLKARRLEVNKGTLGDDGTLTGRGAARLCGVDDHRVMTWYRDGKLVATGRGVERPQGDILRILPADLRAFILAHPEEICLRRIEGDSKAEFLHVVAGDCQARVHASVAEVPLLDELHDVTTQIDSFEARKRELIGKLIDTLRCLSGVTPATPEVTAAPSTYEVRCACGAHEEKQVSRGPLATKCSKCRRKRERDRGNRPSRAIAGPRATVLPTGMLDMTALAARWGISKEGAWSRLQIVGAEIHKIPNTRRGQLLVHAVTEAEADRVAAVIAAKRAARAQKAGKASGAKRATTTATPRDAVQPDVTSRDAAPPAVTTATTATLDLVPMPLDTEDLDEGLPATAPVAMVAPPEPRESAQADQQLGNSEASPTAKLPATVTLAELASRWSCTSMGALLRLQKAGIVPVGKAGCAKLYPAAAVACEAKARGWKVKRSWRTSATTGTPASPTRASPKPPAISRPAAVPCDDGNPCKPDTREPGTHGSIVPVPAHQKLSWPKPKKRTPAPQHPMHRLLPQARALTEVGCQDCTRFQLGMPGTPQEGYVHCPQDFLEIAAAGQVEVGKRRPTIIEVGEQTWIRRDRACTSSACPGFDARVLEDGDSGCDDGEEGGGGRKAPGQKLRSGSGSTGGARSRVW